MGDEDKGKSLNNSDDLEQLKNSLRSQLHKSGMTNVIREMVQHICASHDDLRSLNPDMVIQEVYRKGLMKEFIQKLRHNSKYHHIKTQTSLGDLESLNLKEIEFERNLSKARNSLPEIKDRDKGSIPSEVKISNVSLKPSETKNYSPIMIPPNYSSEDDDENYCGPMNGKYFLKMEILGGKDFLEHIYDDKMTTMEDADGNGHSKPHFSNKFVLHVFYKSQRFHTEPVKARCEPRFNDAFMIELGYFENGSIFQLLASNEPVRILLVRDCDHDGVNSNNLISHCVHDWRPLLMSEGSSQRYHLELMGLGPEHRVPIGLLNIRMSICPPLEEQLKESTYLAHLAVERTRKDEKDRLYLTYAKQWFREYTEIRPEHQNRLVKLFSYDENAVSRPVTSFIRPIIADRVLQTPYQALRFVKLLPVCPGGDAENLLRLNSSSAPKIPGLSNLLSNHWQTIESTIASRSGGVEDHAILLCSLLLGFGFDAYVAIGTRLADIPWVWVITFDADYSPTFWESTTGEKFEHLLGRPGELTDEKIVRLRKNECHKFKAVSCIFNNKCFLANIQASDLIELTDWHLLNPSRWKKLHGTGSNEKIRIRDSVTSAAVDCCPSLFPSRANPVLMAIELENQLRTMISNTRRNHSLQTKWDEEICKLIGQEHARFELGVNTGVSIEKFPSDLPDAILHKIPHGYDYKGYPFEFTTKDAGRIYFECLKERECEKIILCRGVDVNHVVRVDVFVYPEDVLCTRVTIACKYVSVED